MFLKHVKAILESRDHQKTKETHVGRSSLEYEFQPGYLEIAHRPPAPWARRIAALLTLTLLIALAWSVFGRLDINAGATGRLIVSSHSKEIQSIEAGEIKTIHVKEGQRVEAGDPLISLNPIGVDAEIAELEGQLRSQRLLRARMQALLTEQPMNRFDPPADIPPEMAGAALQHLVIEWEETQANLRKLDSDMEINLASQQSLETEITAMEKLTSNIEERLSAWKTLAAEKLHPKMQLLEQLKEQLEGERALNRQKAELAVLQTRYQNLQDQKHSYVAGIRREYYDKLAAADVEIAAMEQRLIKVKERRRLMTLRAPVNGVVQQLAVHTIGGVVEAAQGLMVIVPEGALLEAEVMILNKDVGFVQADQNVEVKVDAFPYTRYGTISGRVQHISRDAVQNEQLGLVFPARVALSRSDIDLEDQRVPLQAGMSLVAEIHTGKRRVIDYLLSPLMQYKSEALRER
ncbi:HlyD family type I secretion periplasmic adaptor subunit [Hahella ganghwensis]|uniref:HlyD family type I secretion periplasmic adaptor subunit n=1 Tax=Hahella ganghwensis TaxID=286420 RepID=UPI00036C4FCC|nr:HlyD family type I secretion periplasmic adaptor subunit [Hahella ganghwensis]